MKNRSWIVAFTLTMAFAACSSTSGNPPGTGGRAGGSTTSGGNPSTGGSSTTPAGGVTGTGGQASGGSQQGGTAAGGGAGGSAGTSSTGGSAAAGGNDAGVTGGAGSGGNDAGVTGGSASGGTTGVAGSGSGGTTASGGTAASGGATSTGGSTGSQHWLGVWTGSPYVDSANPPPVSLANAVLRQVVHISQGGSQLRVLFSNLFGNGPVTISSAHLALCKAAPAVDSSIDTTTDKALAFSGSASVTIAQGKEVWTDPVDFAAPALGNITITTAFGSVPSSVCGHSGSRTTSYIQAGSKDVSAANMTSATKTDHWFYISGIDVMADASAKAIVAIGDSITDGRGTDTNKNNRWTDVLAARLQANAATASVSIMNQGIGATNLVGTSGTAAQARFARDVLGQSGVRYAIVYDGVNDIGSGASFASMKAAYDDLISRAHAKGLLIYGATILPFAGNSYYTTEHEAVRQQVNTYIKSGAFDGYIDFDAALSDRANPPKLQASYAAWSQQDWLHPGPAGYQKMGETVDLALFTK